MRGEEAISSSSFLSQSWFFCPLCFFFAFDFWSTFGLPRRLKSLGEIAIVVVVVVLIITESDQFELTLHRAVGVVVVVGVHLSSLFNLKDAFFERFLSRSANVNRVHERRKFS